MLTVTQEHKKYIKAILGNAMDNAHDMRGEEDWEDGLVYAIIAAHLFYEKFPTGGSYSVWELIKEAEEQLMCQGVWTSGHVNKLIKKQRATLPSNFLEEYLEEQIEIFKDIIEEDD